MERFFLFLALVVVYWVGLGIGYLWGRMDGKDHDQKTIEGAK